MLRVPKILSLTPSFMSVPECSGCHPQYSTSWRWRMQGVAPTPSSNLLARCPIITLTSRGIVTPLKSTSVYVPPSCAPNHPPSSQEPLVNDSPVRKPKIVLGLNRWSYPIPMPNDGPPNSAKIFRLIDVSELRLTLIVEVVVVVDTEVAVRLLFSVAADRRFTVSSSRSMAITSRFGISEMI